MNEAFEQLWNNKNKNNVHVLLEETAKCHARIWYTAGIRRAAEILEALDSGDTKKEIATLQKEIENE